MLNVCIRPQPTVADVPAIAATTAGETSSDNILVERIASGDKLAMQVLFVKQPPKNGFDERMSTH
jgi:hypothetical protein